MAGLDRYLGKGIIFPVELTPQGTPVIRTGADLIKSSIKLILSWPRGQRMFMSEFGSRLTELLEEPNDDLLKGLIGYFINDSLVKFEKRIDVLDITLNRFEPHRLDVELKYRVKTTGLEDVLTFPFYTTKLQ